MPPISARDLDHVLEHTRGLWEEARGERIFLTGGTGFFGCWLLESFIHANTRLGLGAETVVLTRNAGAFREKAPHAAGNTAVQLVEGDIRDFAWPGGTFAYFIHAATDADAKTQREDPLATLDSVVDGTRRTLDMAVARGGRKFLLTSSGTVYGRQPPEMARVAETYTGGPDLSDWRAGYSEGKRMAELLCSLFGRMHGGVHKLETKIARCFAFVGPHLPLDRAFGIGNFLRDAMRGGPVEIQGDGTPLRSYLYAADLAIWLWTILFRGEAGQPYNVGGTQEHSMAEVAAQVAAAFDPRPEIRIAGKHVAGRPAERYIPDVGFAERSVGLRTRIELPEAIRRTVEWLRMGQ